MTNLEGLKKGLNEDMKWLEKTMENLKVGDLVAKNFGSFKKSMAYVVTEIADDKVVCRLLKNSYSVDKLKMNKNYCSKHKVFKLDKMGSFPSILKLNTGYRDTDEVRQKNLENIW